jgi:hypothetical protein
MTAVGDAVVCALCASTTTDVTPELDPGVHEARPKNKAGCLKIESDVARKMPAL